MGNTATNTIFATNVCVCQTSLYN